MRLEGVRQLLTAPVIGKYLHFSVCTYLWHVKIVLTTVFSRPYQILQRGA